MRKMLSNKKWIITHASGVEVSEGEWYNRHLYHKQHREGKYKWLYTLLIEELRGNHWNEHRIGRKNQMFLTLNELCNTATCLVDTKFTAVKNQTDKSTGGGKIRLTGITDKETTSFSYVPELHPARRVFGRNTACFHVRFSRLKTRGCWCITLRKPKSPPWKGGPQKEKPSDYMEQQMEKGRESKA